MKKYFQSSILFFLFPLYTFSQTDSLIENLLLKNGTEEEGLKLLESKNFIGANQYFSNEITKDESDREAYFKRGVSNWALSDTLNACRDWSAVLALGDTAMFNLLESKCHSAMIISDDTIPKSQYRKMWGTGVANTSEPKAKTVVEVMPSFPGGQVKLFEYLSANVKSPDSKKSGIVYVNFLVSPKGKIVYPHVTRGLTKLHNKEAIRVIKNMPEWKPGMQNGKPVYVRGNVPVKF